MKKALFVFALAAALVVAVAIPASAQTLENGVTLVAAKKHKVRRYVPRGSGYIACTFVGCIRIPPGCRPVTDYNWDGIPTGYDAVVCPNGKFYSRS